MSHPNIVPETWSRDHQTISVTGVALHGFRQDPDQYPHNGPKGTALVHWQVSFLLVPASKKTAGRSVTMDAASISASDGTVKISIKGHPYALSYAVEESGEVIDLPKATLRGETFTTVDIRNLIIEHNLHYYTFNQEGSGCLFWAGALLRAMEGRGFLKSGAVKFVTDKIDTLRAAIATRELYIPKTRGEFTRAPELNGEDLQI